MRYPSVSLVTILLAILIICSCSTTSAYSDKETILDQQYLIAFLEDIVNSQKEFSVKSFTRRTFSPLIKQTDLLKHSFYLIDLNDWGYHTLSFSSADLKLFTEGMWVLNKETDISSYRLFVEGNNIWDVSNLFTEDLIDSYQTIKNIISAIKSSAKYYYRDHLKKKQNSFNCNSALYETVVLKQEMCP